MIDVRDLSKRYGSNVAIRNVSFQVAKGEVVGFLGPNGAGKSTTLRIIAGVLGASAGAVTVMGHDIEAEPMLARRAIGFMPETVPLYPEMRVAEYLSFRAELKGVPRKLRASCVESALVRACVIESANRTIGHLSKGYRQRVGIADALVANPPVLVLDEPTAGLDPNQIRETRDLVKELGREHAVLISTHILGEAEAICGRIVVISRGEIVAAGTRKEIEKLAKVQRAEIVIRGDAPRAALALQNVLGSESALSISPLEAPGECHRITFSLPNSEPERAAEVVEQAVLALVTAKLAIRDVRRSGGSLEQVFSELTTDTQTALPKALGPGTSA